VKRTSHIREPGNDSREEENSGTPQRVLASRGLEGAGTLSTRKPSDTVR